MTSKAEKDRGKQIEDKCQALLTEMLRDEDNKYCVDCDAKGPRWASWNLGIFLCIRCAGIHRNLGVHISKVKSVNLDTWTPEQVVSLQQMGNSRARAVYEANIPDNFRRPQSDSALEAFVRAKYEHKKYIAKEWVPTPVPNVKQSWERELDEEAERQRRRKREAKQVRAVRNEVGTPQPLPKPREAASSSPRPQRAAAAAQPRVDLFFDASPAAAPEPATANGAEDGFGGFLSAPAPAAAAPVDAAKASPKAAAAAAHDGRSAEEDSFFNQPAPTSQEKRQLTKDSILALYASAQPQQQQQQQQQQQGNMFGMPSGGAFPPQQPAFGSFGQPPLGAQLTQNGPFNLAPTQNVSMFGTASAQNAPFSAAGTQNNQFNMAGPQNGQFSMQGMPNGQFQQGVNNGQFSLQGQNGAFSMAGAQNGPFGGQPGALGSNPFFNMGANPMGQHGFPQMSQLPQQMGRMNLGPSQPQNQTSIPGQSLANNLWQ